MSAKRTWEEFTSDSINTTENFDKALGKLNMGLNPREIFKKTFKPENIYFSSNVTAVLRKVMKKMPAISNVQLCYCSYDENEDLKFILDNPNVESLGILATHSQLLGADSFHKNLAANTTLRSLKLYCFSFREGSICGLTEALRLNTTLTSFSMNSTVQTLQDSLNFFKVVINHPSIQFLRYELNWHKEVDNFYLEPVDLKFGNLISLDLSNSIFCEYIGTNLFKSLIRASKLKILKLQHSSLGFMTRQFGQYLRQTTILEELYMRSTYLQNDCVPDVLDSMTFNKSIKVVELFDLGNYVSTFSYFYKFLKENDTVETLSYDTHIISRSEIVQICNTLETNTTLTNLYLYPSTRLKTEGSDIIYTPDPVASLIRRNSTLQKLELCNIRLDDNCVLEISSALEDNRTLRYLSLQRNLITDKGLSYLAQVLNINTTLTSLDLQGNGIKYHDTAFNDALIINTTLLSLDLYGNPWDMQGFSNIISSLPSLQVLRELTLSQKYVEGNTYQMISHSLMLNTTLVSFNIHEKKGDLFSGDIFLGDLYQKRSLFELLYFSLYSTYPL